MPKTVRYHRLIASQLSPVAQSHVRGRAPKNIRRLVLLRVSIRCSEVAAFPHGHSGRSVQEEWTDRNVGIGLHHVLQEAPCTRMLRADVEER